MGFRAPAVMEINPGGGLRWPVAVRVALYERYAAGETYAQLSRAFNMACSTVRSICENPETVAMANPARALSEKKTLESRFVHVIHRSLDRVTDEKLDACTAPQLLMVAGIAADKVHVISSTGLRGIGARDTITSILQEVETLRARRLELLEPAQTVE